MDQTKPADANSGAEICGDELVPGITCQSPRWRCLAQDHGWSDGKRQLTWKNTRKPTPSLGAKTPLPAMCARCTQEANEGKTPVCGCTAYGPKIIG